MPVVEKIETLFDNGIDVTMFTDGILFENWREEKEIVRLTKAELADNSRINFAYEGIVEFIKWYNSAVENERDMASDMGRESDY